MNTTDRFLVTRSYRAMVSAETGAVRVWDRVAGHYTVCHSLTPAQERYIRGRAT